MSSTFRTTKLFKFAMLLSFGWMLASCDSAEPVSTATTSSTPATVAGDPVAFSASTYSVSQGAGFVILSVARSGTSTDSISVDYASADGSAIGGTDYTAVSGTLLWAENDTSPKTISVPVSNAVPFAGSKNFTVTLSDPSSGAAISSPDVATVTISGDAVTAVGMLELSDASYAVDQGSGTVTISVNRNGGSSGAVGVSYATANGTAVAGTDYTAASGTIQWSDGDATAKTITVAISDATLFTGTKTFSIALSAASGGATLGTPGSATVTIDGDATPSAGTLQLSSATYSVGQGTGSVTITANRTGGSSGAITVAYSTANGTAVAGTDYTAASGTLSWANGDTAAKTFTVTVSNGSPFTGTKAFTVALSAPSSTTAVSSPGKATVTITGDGSTSTASDLLLSSSTYAVAQSAGTVTVTVDRTGSTATAVGVTYTTANGTAVAGSDYTEATGTLQWAAGDGSAKTFTVGVSKATAFSGTKTFTVALSDASGGATLGTAMATVTITGSTVAAPSGAFWVYYNGVFNWGGDYSTAGKPNYSSTAGAPESGAYDIAFQVTGRYGIWAPYAGGTVPLWNFDSTGYNYFTIDLKPTVANQSWQFYFMQVGDKQIIGANGKQIILNLANYGPAPVVGQWGTYKIPLVDVLTQYSSGSPVYETSIYKFGLQDETGSSSNTWYVDNVGFTVN